MTITVTSTISMLAFLPFQVHIDRRIIIIRPFFKPVRLIHFYSPPCGILRGHRQGWACLNKAWDCPNLCSPLLSGSVWTFLVNFDCLDCWRFASIHTCKLEYLFHHHCFSLIIHYLVYSYLHPHVQNAFNNPLFFPDVGGCFFPKALKGDTCPESFEIKRMSFTGGIMKTHCKMTSSCFLQVSLNILTFEKTSIVMSDIVLFLPWNTFKVKADLW